jgi:hypothetical protein
VTGIQRRGFAERAGTDRVLLRYVNTKSTVSTTQMPKSKPPRIDRKFVMGFLSSPSVACPASYSGSSVLQRPIRTTCCSTSLNCNMIATN